MPDWKTLVRERMAPLRLRPEAEADLVEEYAQHLEDHHQELLRGGASEGEAYAETVAELQQIDLTGAALPRRHRAPEHDPVPPGDAGSGSILADLGRDLRYAIRSIRKSPVFVFFVVGTLALGIGANTTVFTLINTLLLNPLPVRNMGGLAAVAATEASDTAQAKTPYPLSYPDWQDYERGNRVFRSLAGYTASRMVTWQEGEASERIFAELVTHNYFSTLGLAPAKGRFFVPGEDSTPGEHAVAVVSYGAWKSRFGAQEDILGRTVRLNGISFTVIGVAPPRFIGVNAIFGPDVWIPAAMAEALLPNELPNALTDRGKALFTGIGRYREGVNRAQAQANLEVIAAQLAREHQDIQDGHRINVRPVRDVVFGSAGTGSTPIVYASALLLAVVGIVLLIACSNVANLLLARAAARRQEMAVRLAMGAGRPRLVRQLLTESVLLGLLSGLAGLVLGYAGLQLLFSRLPSAANFAAPKFDGWVFLFALAVSLVTAFLFGTMPAFRASRADVADTLKEETRTAGRNRRRITVTNTLVVGQVAFSFLLLVTAALFLRSISRAYQLDPGFQTAHLAVFMANPGQAGYKQPQTVEFYRSARERVAAIPGVASASWATNLPLWARPVNGVEVEGREQRSRTDRIRAIVNTVDLEYFTTAGVPLEAGREFTVADQDGTTPVAIVNQKMAHDFWPGGAIGKRVQLPGEKSLRVVVGVARNANYTSWGESPQPCVYLPLSQNYADAMTLFVRSERDPKEILALVQKEVHALAPPVLLSAIRTGSDIMDGGLFQAKMGVGLLAAFGLLALGLASIGLYGILAYSVNQRRREIGLRMALGASSSSVLRLVLQQGLTLVGMGLLAGLIASLAVGRVLSGMLFGVSASDPLSMGAAALILSGIALLACFLPAYRATRIDPLTALHTV